ncbi:hypothetical protein EOD40_01825 [Flavobacterium sufflavum]|uniref:Uncharacterized protein n=1 Tax=Flavobacterium sufflavum TaxID=1921138 RepID=A0A3S2UT17_9FLAO|nr:hypothetical protein [Flavobacterium sufflavum]RVT79873.1 hypothetical protein EOD40_01825 [Flavobacterium sufflavum]
MKKIALFLVLMTSLLSCSVDQPDSYTNYILPIDSYTLPSTFTVGATHEVKLKFQKPTACYNYGGIYYYSLDNTRTIAIYADVKNGEVCSEALPPLSEVSFNFVPSTAGTYIFKFYKGKDDAGTDVFEDVEITVTE